MVDEIFRTVADFLLIGVSVACALLVLFYVFLDIYELVSQWPHKRRHRACNDSSTKLSDNSAAEQTGHDEIESMLGKEETFVYCAECIYSGWRQFADTYHGKCFGEQSKNYGFDIYRIDDLTGKQVGTGCYDGNKGASDG